LSILAVTVLNTWQVSSPNPIEKVRLAPQIIAKH